MKNERNALKAGLFIVVSIALMVGVVIGIKGLKRFLEPAQQLQVRFHLSDDIGGLAAGDPVRIGGANVGTVREVELITEGENPGIVITFAIPKKFNVHQDATLNIQTTITGVSVLNFTSLGTATGTLLAENAVLQGKSNASFAELAATYNETGKNATDLIKHIKSKIDPIIERYNKFADKGAFALDQIGSLFSDTKSDFRGTIANLNTATSTVKEKLPNIMDKVDGTLTKISHALDETNSALADIRATVANAREASVSARSILVNNQSKIDKMISSLKTAGDNLKFATAEIRRSPWRLLYKPGPGEMANLNLYDSARQFAEGANNMSDAAEALRDALKDPKTDKDKVQHLVDQLDERFQKFNEVEAELWKQVKE